MRRQSDNLKANLCQAQQRDLKTIAPLLHRPIVLTDTIDYRTIGFLHYRPNPVLYVNVCKHSSGWISYDNYIHITRPDAKKLYLIATFCSPVVNFVRHMVMCR